MMFIYKLFMRRRNTGGQRMNSSRLNENLSFIYFTQVQTLIVYVIAAGR